MEDHASATTQQSYAKSLGIWIQRHREALDQVRAMEDELMNLHRTLCAVVLEQGGSVTVSPQVLEAMTANPILTVTERAEDHSVVLAVKSE